MTFQFSAPVGERCYCNALVPGDHRNQWNREVEPWRDEMRRLHSKTLDSDLSPAAHADLFALLVSLMIKAESGALRFGKTAFHDADVMDRNGWIIELKPVPDPASSFGRPLKHLRMYCAEPAREEATIIGLHVATKSSGDGWAQEQDAAIDESESRANEWSRNKYAE